MSNQVMLPRSICQGFTGANNIELYDTILNINVLSYLAAPLSTARWNMLMELLMHLRFELGWEPSVAGTGIAVPILDLLLDRIISIRRAGSLDAS